MLRKITNKTIVKLIELIDANKITNLLIQKEVNKGVPEFYATYHTAEGVEYDNPKVLEVRHELEVFYHMLKHEEVHDFYLYFDVTKEHPVINKSYGLPEQSVLEYEHMPEVNAKTAAEVLGLYIHAIAEDKVIEGISKVRKGQKSQPVKLKEAFDLIIKAVDLDGDNDK